MGVIISEPKERPRVRRKKGGIEGEKLEPEVLSKMLKKAMKTMKNRGYYIIPSKLLYLKSVAAIKRQKYKMKREK